MTFHVVFSDKIAYEEHVLQVGNAG